MEAGFGSITCQRYPGDPRGDGDRYREALALLEEAERLGFDSVWASEHHFFDDSYLPSVLPFSAAIAARTSRVTFGTDVLLAPLYEPVRLAEDATTVDLLSGGRFVLGLAQGWRPEEFEGLGIPLKGRHRRPREVVTTLRHARPRADTSGHCGEAAAIGRRMQSAWKFRLNRSDAGPLH